MFTKLSAMIENGELERAEAELRMHNKMHLSRDQRVHAFIEQRLSMADSAEATELRTANIWLEDYPESIHYCL